MKPLRFLPHLYPILIGALFLASPAAAQQWDPDRCLTCKDSWQHAAAGAGIDVAAQILLPRSRTWQRLAIVGTIAIAYELGQESTSRSAGVHGPGYGLGPKDLLMGLAGAAAVEFVWNEIRPRRRGSR